MRRYRAPQPHSALHRAPSALDPGPLRPPILLRADQKGLQRMKRPTPLARGDRGGGRYV